LYKLNAAALPLLVLITSPATQLAARPAGFDRPPVSCRVTYAPCMWTAPILERPEGPHRAVRAERQIHTRQILAHCSAAHAYSHRFQPLNANARGTSALVRLNVQPVQRLALSLRDGMYARERNGSNVCPLSKQSHASSLHQISAQR
jgi:hypothetical protein